MRIILYIVILLLIATLPADRIDVAKLEPVEAVAVMVKDGKVIVMTDTGSQGSGQTPEEALQNLKENALGIIYLDTAEYLLASEKAEELLPKVLPEFKETVKIGPYKGGEITNEVAYLESHGLKEKSKPEN